MILTSNALVTFDRAFLLLNSEMYQKRGLYNRRNRRQSLDRSSDVVFIRISIQDQTFPGLVEKRNVDPDYKVQQTLSIRPEEETERLHSQTLRNFPTENLNILQISFENCLTKIKQLVRPLNFNNVKIFQLLHPSF